LAIPSIRKYAAQRLANHLKEKKNIDISIGYVDFFPIGKVQTENILIRDHHHDTLISISNLKAHLSDLLKIYRNQWDFNNAYIEQASLYLTRYKNEQDDNLNIFLRKIEGNNSSGNGQFRLTIKSVRINGFDFILTDENIKSRPLYSVHRLNGHIKKFTIHGKTVSADIDSWQFTDFFGHQIQHFQTTFLYTPDSMLFRKLNIRTTNTEIGGEILFYYTIEQLKHFFQEVQISGYLQGNIATDDINLLSDSILGSNQKLRFKTRLNGYFNELDLDSLEISTPDHFLMQGDVTLYNITETDKFGFHFFSNKTRFAYPQLEKLFPLITKKYIPHKIDVAGNFLLNGEVVYKDRVFKTNADLTTEIGQISPRIQIDLKKETYSGNITYRNFQLGKLLNDKNLQSITGKINISGTHFKPQQMQSRFKAEIQKLQWHGYPYRNILLKGKIINQQFSTRIQTADPALKLNGLVQIGFDRNPNHYLFKANITRFDLYKTGWNTKDTLAKLHGNIQADLAGNRIDNITGKIRTDSIHYVNSRNRYEINNLELLATDLSNQRKIEIRSPSGINGYLKGKFQILRLGTAYKTILGSVFTGIAPEIPEKNKQYLSFNFNIDNNLLELVDPLIHQVKKLQIKGKIDQRRNYIHTEIKSDLFSYGDFSVYKPEISIDNNNPIYNLYIQSDSLTSSVYSIRNIRAINLSIRDTVYLKLKANGGIQNRDTFNITGFYVLDSSRILRYSFMPSLLKINNIPWKIKPGKKSGEILYDLKNARLSIDNIRLKHQSEQITLYGYDRPTERNITLNIHQLKLNNIIPRMEMFRFDGLTNGNIQARKKNGNVFYNARITVEDFKFNDTPMGDVNLEAKSLKNQLVFIELKTGFPDRHLIHSFGYLDLVSNELDFNVNTDQFPLKVFNPVMHGIFDRIRGSASGHFTISGKFTNPQYHGTLNLFDAGLRVIELNTDYTFDNNTAVQINGQQFDFNNARFTDTKYHSAGQLNGLISFYNFSNWFLDLKIDTDNLLVLNTPPTDNALYYGTAFVQGNGKIYGHVNKINIDAKVKSNDGTRIFIPLHDVETVGEDDFIKFYTPESYANTKKHKKRQEKIYEGLNLNLDIDITRDAEIEIVLDQVFGSKLSGRGEGTMLMEINTEGKFNMWGSYQVVEGYYYFRYAGVIDKKFEVEPGGTIIWNGDPFRADLDIKAVYHIPAADVTPLLKDETLTNKKIPVDVIILIKGDLMKPKIDFQVEVPQANSVIRSQIEYALIDPDKRMLQVVSLLYSGSFISEDVLRFNNRAAVEGTLSERVLSQFNSLLENDIFNVKLNYVPGQENPETNVKTATQVGLTVQTKINKRIYINGKLAMPVGRYTRSSVSGDIEANLWLTPEGNLQLRLFNKRTEIEYADQKESYTQGAGIFYQVDFDTFKELARKLGFHIKTE